MGSKVLMSVEEYLHTSFDGPDCEYLDGEVVERNVGELPHSTAQRRLIVLLDRIAGKTGVQVQPEIRVRISGSRYRVPDIGVWRAGEIGTRIPETPPFLAIEILSADDRIVRVQPKIAEYLAIGVEYVWLVDPDERRAICYSRSCPAGELSDVLATRDPDIEIRFAELFEV